jgi:hypothetical protein
MIRFINVLPVDFLWLRGILELDITLIIRRNMKDLPQLFLRHIFETVKDGTFLILSPAGKYHLFCDALIFLLKFELLVAVSHKLMLLRRQLPLQLLHCFLVSLLISQQGTHSIYYLLLLIFHPIEIFIVRQKGDLICLVRLI